MPEMLIQWLAGGLVAVAIAALARWRHLLTLDGAVAAAAVGTIVVGAGGWWWSVVLIAFFVSSSALSKLRRERGGGVARRGHERDAVQVIANGAAATALAAAGLITPAALDPARFALFCGAIAAVNADTWATEIGRFSRGAPRLITNWRPVAPGASGGITPVGTAGSALGALVIGALAALGAATGWAPAAPPWLLLTGTTAAGLIGSLLDSLLGATVQASYRDPRTGQTTESPTDPAGAPNELVRGVAWVNNDLVNLAASLGGAVGMGLLWLIAS